MSAQNSFKFIKPSVDGVYSTIYAHKFIKWTFLVSFKLRVLLMHEHEFNVDTFNFFCSATFPCFQLTACSISARKEWPNSLTAGACAQRPWSLKFSFTFGRYVIWRQCCWPSFLPEHTRNTYILVRGRKSNAVKFMQRDEFDEHVINICQWLK